MAAIAQRIRNLRTEPIAEPVSQLAPVAFVAFAVCLLIILGVREALEKYSLPYFHREGYSLQTDKDRRSFVQNYLHAIGRVIIIAFAVWPLGAILAGHGNWQTTYLGLVTYGDIELVAMQLTIALYFHDLLYRIKVSPVTLLHHVGAICVGAYAIIMCADYEDNLHAHAYFCIASIWGTYEPSQCRKQVKRPFQMNTLVFRSSIQKLQWPQMGGSAEIFKDRSLNEYTLVHVDHFLLPPHRSHPQPL